MKLRKFFIISAIMVVLMVMLAMVTSAVEIKFGYEFFESVVAVDSRAEEGEVNERKDMLHKLFDGSIATKGIGEDGFKPEEVDKQNSWIGGIGDYILITFNEVTPITGIDIYVTGNWTWATIELIDENGETISFIDGDHIIANENPYGDTAVKKVALPHIEDEVNYLKVKQIKITVASLKWGRHSTYTLSELEITGIHDHKFDTYERLLVQPTCALPGVEEYSCYCGELTELPVDPTGNHTIREDVLLFRNGYSSSGFLGDICETCDTQDIYDVEIGALFTSLGYSVPEDGSGGVQFGFAINYDNIALFNTYTPNGPIEFGIVAGSRAVLADGNPLVFSDTGIAAAANGIACKDLTSTGYYTVSYKLSGFSSDYNDVELFLAAYVYDGLSISYIGEGSTYDIVTVSVNGLTNAE